MRGDRRRRMTSALGRGRRGRLSFPPEGPTELEGRVLPAVIVPFSPRFTANDSGDILFVANTLMTAPATDAGASAAQAGTGTRLNNNDFTMAYVDVDANPSTFNSSRATLALPAGGSVLFAGLYWGAQSGSASRTSVQFATPASGGAYATVAGTLVGADSTTNYEAFADVTAAVRAAGNGEYAVANVQANVNSADKHAGWALVVVYRDPAAPPRNLVVFDGLARVDSSSAAVTVPISGFVAPPTGTVNARVGVVSYEGDRGYTGDSMRLNGTVLSNAANPSDNFFNSTITNLGGRVSTKAPDYVNQLGFDADIINTTGIIANGATSATIGLTTSNDVYLPGVVTTAIDLYAPVVSSSKSVVDLNGGDVEPGDILEYTVTVGVTSGEAATRTVVLDPIPAGASYVAGSLQVVSGANAGSKTDAGGDDQAEFDAANNRVAFRVGAGATGTLGGSIAVGASATVRFRVVVSAAIADGAGITNQATVTFVGQNTGASLAASSTASAVVVRRKADLALTQAVSVAAPNVGDVVTFTLNLINNGPFSAAGVRVDDLLPAGLQYISSSASQGAYDPASGVWDVGDPGVGALRTLTIQARVTASTPVTNSASIRAETLTDPVASNNSASITVTPQRSDLELVKSVSDPRPNVNGTVTFTTTLTNRGPSAATGVAISDLLPAGFNLGTFSSSRGSYDAGTGLWTVGSLAPGASATLALTAAVTSPDTSVATASIASVDQFDPITANNVGTATVTPRRADLVVSTGVDKAQPNVGDVITYTVTVFNNGPDAATGVRVGSTGVPSQVQVLSVTTSRGSFNPATSLWSVGDVGVGSSERIVFVARVNAASITPVTVSINGADQYDPDTTNNSSRTSVNPQEASLSLTSLVDNPRPEVGDQVTLTVSLRNDGPSPATGVVVTDVLPAGLALVTPAASRGTYNASTGVWSVGGVAVGEVVTLTLVARVEGTSPMTHVATISASDQADPNPDVNTSTLTITPRRADLFLTVDASDETPNVGDTVTLTITLNNLGPDAASGVRITGSFPEGMTPLSVEPSRGIFDPATGIWDVGTVDVLSLPSLVLRLRVDTPTPKTGSARILDSGTYDPNPSNNLLSTTFIPQVADLALAQAVDIPRPNVGDVVTFTVTLNNAGPDAASGIRVLDLLPPGLTLVSASPGQGTYSPTTGLWDVGALGAGASQTLVLQARVVDPGAKTNVASLIRADQADPDPTNAVATAGIVPQRADLVVSKSASTAAPNVGDVVTFTVTLSNAGPDAATGVFASDHLPANLSLVTFATSQGTYDPATGVWDVGTLAPSGVTTLVVRGRVEGTSVYNETASVVRADQYDPDTGNNSSSVSGAPQVIDLGVTKSVDVARPNVGDIITLTVALTNAGPSTATNVAISSPAGLGLTFLSAEASQGTFDPATNVWLAGDVPASGSGWLRVRAVVASAGVITSRAGLIHADQFDSAPGNNTSSVGIVPQRSDLSIGMRVDNPSARIGQLVTYTITLWNTGPDAASNVRVLDALPPGLQFVSASATQGGYDPATGLWTVGAIGTSWPYMLQIVARVVAPGGVVNTASIVGAAQFDPDAANNTASAWSSTEQADLALNSSFDAARPNVGDLVTFIVTLSNAGTAAAGDALIMVELPPGLQYLSHSETGGIYDGDGIWFTDPVEPGGWQTLRIMALVTSPDVGTASARIFATDQSDPSAGNNATSATITPRQADLSLSLTVDDPAPDVGQVVTFTVSAGNAGPDAANGVRILDLLPPGLTFIDATGPGSYDPRTGAWQAGTIDPGHLAALRIRARVEGPAALITASIAAVAEFDPRHTNDTASVAVVPTQADLVVGLSADETRPNVGDQVTFSITVSNNGPDAASGVRVLDLLPAGLDLDAADPSQGVYSRTTGIWEVGSVAPGSSATLVLVLKATVLGPDPVTNTASIVASDQFDPDPGSNVASVVLTPRSADLALSNVADNPTPDVGGVVTFTVTLANLGGDAATGVRVMDAVPAGLALLSAEPGAGSYDPSTGVWSVPEVAAGGSVVLTLRARVIAPSPSVSVATITAARQYDPGAANNTAVAAVTPRRADLHLAGSVDVARPDAGAVVTFTLTVTDPGPDAAGGVAVSVPLPAGYTFVDATGPGTYDPSTGRWTIGAIGAGGSATLALRARVDVEAPPAVSAAIVAADQFDPNAGDNAVTLSVAPRRVNLGVAMTVSNPAPNVGEAITYTVFLRNDGPDAATGIRLLDTLPSGVSTPSATPGRGSYDSDTGIWAVDTLAPGEEVTLTLSVTVTDPDAANNRMELLAVDQFETQSSDNAAETSSVPQQAELRLSHQVDDPTPDVGQTVTFTLTITNLGPDDATGVLVDEVLPAGLGLVSSNAGAGTYDEATGRWSVGSLPSGATATLTVSAVVGSPAPAAATATIFSADQFDPNLGNNTSLAQVRPRQAGLGISQGVDVSRPNVGDVVRFTVTVTNAGPDDAAGVRVAEPLPEGLVYVGAAATSGIYDSSTGLWQVGTLARGTSATLVVEARVASGGAATVTASLLASGTFDPSPSDNSASATITPRRSDLAVAVSADEARPDVGEVVTITVTLSGGGPEEATGVRVLAPLPAGLDLVSASPSRGTYDPASGLWRLDAVGAGSSSVLVLRALVASPSASTVLAQVAGADQSDPDGGNNAASVTLVPLQADLAMGLTVDNARPNVGDEVTFTVTVTNNGPDAATAVVVVDELSPGLTFVGADPGQGAFSPSNGIWSPGSIPPSATLTLIVRARVDSGDALLGVATLIASDQYDPDPSDNTASVTLAPQRADLSLAVAVDSPRPDVGDLVTFTVTLTNGGPDAATRVRVRDLLPAGLAFVSADPGVGTYDPTTGFWEVGTVGPSAATTLRLTARVDGPDAATNVASLIAVDQFDPDGAGGVASATVSPLASDLALTSSFDVVAPVAGQVVTYRIAVANAGPDAATGVVVVGALPAGLEFVSATSSRGGYDPSTGRWSVGSVAVGTSEELLVTARVVGSAPSLVVASILASDRFDSNPGSRTTATALLPQVADLGLTMTFEEPPGPVGTVVYTITASNAGPDAATGVRILDLLPPGFQFVSASSTRGGYDPATGLWTVGTVGAGGSEALVLTALASPSGRPTNVATIGGVDQFDENPANDRASVLGTFLQADLGLSAGVDHPSPTVGDVVTLTVALSNGGIDAGTNVVVSAPIPPGFALVGASADLGAYDPASGTWTLPRVEPGTTPILRLSARVDGAGPLRFEASVASADQSDPSPGNNASAVAVTAAPRAPGATARLGGSLFSDADGDGLRSPGEPGLGGVRLVLEGVASGGEPVRRETITAPDGSYAFEGLLPGVYTLIAGLPGARAVGGDLGGAPASDRITGIVLDEGASGGGYNFLLDPPAPVSPAQPAPSRLAGAVYLDVNRNGIFDGPDLGIASVRILLAGVDDLGATVRLETTTAADGSYAFEGLRPGTYALQQVQPRVFRDARETAGTLGGTTQNDRFGDIGVGSGVSGVGYHFGERLRPGCRLRGPVLMRLLGGATPRRTASAPRGTLGGVRGDATPLPRGPLIHRYFPSPARAEAGRPGPRA